MKKVSVIFIALFILSFPRIAECADIPEYMPYLYEDFENGTAGVSSAGDAVPGGYGNSAGCLKFTQTGNMAAPAFPMKLELEKTYKISMRMKAIDDILVNNGSFILNFVSKSNGRYGYASVGISNVNFASKEWVEVTANYTFNGKAQIIGGGSMDDADGSAATFQFRIGDGQLANITSGSSFSYYIDDVSVIPADLPISETEDYYPEPKPEINPDDLKNKITNGDFTSALDDTWEAANASIEISNEVPDGEEYTNSLHVTETGNNGRFGQSAAINRGLSYKLSFWAKGISAKPGVELVGSAIVPRFKTEDGRIQRFTDEDGILVFSEKWKKYEVILKPDENYTAIEFITGTNGRNRTEYMITGISLNLHITEEDEEDDVPKYPTPEIRNLSYDGLLVTGKTVNITAEYMGINEKSGFVQLFKQAEDNGWASIMIAKFTDTVSYTFRNEDVGQKIKIRIVPMDVEGQIGGYRELETKSVLPVLTVVPEFTTNIEETVSAKICAENYGDDVDIVGILVLLDEDNSCVDIAYKYLKAAYGENEPVTVSATNPENKAIKAKLYIWEGKSDVDTTMLSVADSIEIIK